MLIQIFVLDSASQKTLISQTEVDALRLMIMAESREQLAREKGEAFTAGAVPFFAQQLISAVQANKPLADIELQATNAALAAWLHDSLFGNVTAEQFTRSHLVFTLLEGGAVKYERVMLKKI